MRKIDKEIYCDCAATTPLCESACKAIMENIEDFYNSASLYPYGKRVSKKIERSREEIANIIRGRPEEIYFTSGGCEANSWAIKILSDYAKKIGKKHIITSAFEHHSILNALNALKSEGFEITYINPMPNGVISPDEVKNAIRPDTAFCSIMTVNNEVGTIQPISQIGDITSAARILFHTDAVQATGHIPIDVSRMKIDLLSFSGHKFGGPKGIGGLYCAKWVEITPLIYGGSQESGVRGGTSNTIDIVAMTEALKESTKNLREKSVAMFVKRDKLERLLKSIDGCRINGSTFDRVPGTINVSFKGISGESLALLLAGDGILVSTTSACSVGSGKYSHVLESMNVGKEYIGGTIRISLPQTITAEEIEYIAEKINEYVEKLRRISNGKN